MARKPRVEMADGVHHVFARGNGRQLLFLDDADRGFYLALLARVVVWKRWRCLAYCLMDNHVHLLIETPLPNLGAGMQWLHSRFAHRFNSRHCRTGHVFENRFGSVLMGSDAQLWTAAAYIARNPVTAGLCARPTDWPWSSHRAIVDRVAVSFLDHDRLLSYYDALGGDPWRRYREVVERGDLLTIGALGGAQPLREAEAVDEARDGRVHVGRSRPRAVAHTHLRQDADPRVVHTTMGTAGGSASPEAEPPR